MTEKLQGQPGETPRKRSQQDLGGGLFLIAIGLFAIWQGSNLPLGTLRSMGAGMLPISLAWMLIAGGALLAITSFTTAGPDLERWSLRGLCYIIGGVLVFAFTVQRFGLIVAGPLSMIIGSFASEEARLKEAIIFAVIMTALCILLFKYALGLPIPVMNFRW